MKLRTDWKALAIELSKKTSKLEIRVAELEQQLKEAHNTEQGQLRNIEQYKEIIGRN